MYNDKILMTSEMRDWVKLSQLESSIRKTLFMIPIIVLDHVIWTLHKTYGY